MTAKYDIIENREFLFWHKLNKQLLMIKKNGKPIEKEYHANLQKFCFNNNLYEKATDSSVVFGVPLSLITNFQKIFFITVGLRSWTNLLTTLLADTYVLNIEKALTEVFDDIVVYDNKYHLIDNAEAEEDADEDLYKFIDDYLNAKESMAIDLPSLVIESHQWKLKALKKIINNIDYAKNIAIKDNQLHLNLIDTSKIDKINELYKNIFCANSNPHPSGNDVKWVSNMNKVQTILSNKLKEPNLKQIIKEFILHELPTCKTEIALIRNYSKEIRNRINVGLPSKVVICDINKFAFLNNPFPLV
ncbi:MAG TPA: hypothetical protein PKZ86_00300 [Smithella sp.]|nr:hypothetical protein [Smithella sp.]HQH15546.1 hypothetical protein [Smithella sp.]